MTKFYELDDTDNLTGYHIYASDHKCIHSYKHVMHNNSGHSMKLSDTTVYTYSQYDPAYCKSISNENSFYTCLKSCKSTKTCEAYLENSITIVKDQYGRIGGSDFSDLTVIIRPVSKGYTSGTASYDSYITPTLELSGIGVYFNSLDVSGVNLKGHDVSNGGGAIFLQKSLVIHGGSHQFNNNQTHSTDGIGAIFCAGDIYFIDVSMIFKDNSGASSAVFNDYGGIYFIDASITFMNNVAVEEGCPIYTNSLLSISGSKTNLYFKDNSGYSAGAITSSNLNINIEGSGQIIFSGNQSVGGGGAITTLHGYTSLNGIIINTKGSGQIIFDSNNSAWPGGAISTLGGIIINTEGSGQIIFDSNNSALPGGAISSWGDIIINTEGSGQIIFSGNQSVGGGGAIYATNDISFINASISFRNNYTISGPGGAINQTSGELSFQGGTYEFSNNIILNNHSHGSAIGGDKIHVGHKNSKTILNFTNNSGGDTIWVNSFDTSLACPSLSGDPGCSNNYNFYGNIVNNNNGIIGFRDNLYMAGGYWDFSNNKINNTSNTTTIYGYPTHSSTKKSTISIRNADINFDKTFITYGCSTDVSNIGLKKGSAATQDQKYYNYKISHTTDYSGNAAYEISKNRYNVQPSALLDSTD